MRALLENPERAREGGRRPVADPEHGRGVAADVPGVRPLPPHRDRGRRAQRPADLGGRQGGDVVRRRRTATSRATRIRTASTSSATPSTRPSAPAGGTSASAPRWPGSSCNILFEETLKRYPGMELAGEPEYAVSPFINQLETLPVKLGPSARRTARRPRRHRRNAHSAHSSATRASRVEGWRRATPSVTSASHTDANVRLGDRPGG